MECKCLEAIQKGVLRLYLAKLAFACQHHLRKNVDKGAEI
jgi:hypothetical protein